MRRRHKEKQTELVQTEKLPEAKSDELIVVESGAMFFVNKILLINFTLIYYPSLFEFCCFIVVYSHRLKLLK